MTNELGYRMLEFEGQTSWIWCMLHVRNLVAKTMVRQFDLPRNQEMGELGTELAEWADEDDYSAMATDIDDNDDKGWVDEVTELTAEEQAGLE
ncbi:hypothetical protein F5141DRAFT_1010816 [Pisolithus sp. B1]|nr:hypothetical protein F5141DRAFT_1010816 [Pisolithus sp. B1]